MRATGGAFAESVREYRPDLDGLRAIAVGLVMATHAKWPWPNNGGDPGVTAFFVLSGFLITNLLLAQSAERGSVDIKAFYRRRIIRLGPALLALLVFVLVSGVLVGWPTHWGLGLLASVGYVANWVEVAGTNIDPLGHTWSLAIEEQFYVLWPAVVVLTRGRVLRIALVGIVLGTALRTASAGHFEYYSTVTRADAILAGAVVAVARLRFPAWAGWTGLLVLVAVAALDLGHDLAITMAMVASMVIVASRLPTLGHFAPIGRRAYSLYLWNWPMTLLFGAMGLLAPLATVLVAEASFRLFEAPVIHRGSPTESRGRLPLARQAKAEV